MNNDTPTRPSNHEKHKKISDALAAISAGKRMVVVQEKHLSSDLDELSIESEELWSVMGILVKEIQDCGPEKCYAGCHPPTRSYEPEIRDEELWAYSWPSAHFGFQMYIKFVMRQNATGEWVYLHLRVHRDET
ncbi:MAG: hypothetical protein ABSA47_05705 [Verrucomicrobiota bacterium]|jgi:hypothetical protein